MLIVARDEVKEKVRASAPGCEWYEIPVTADNRDEIPAKILRMF